MSSKIIKDSLLDATSGSSDEDARVFKFRVFVTEDEMVEFVDQNDEDGSFTCDLNQLREALGIGNKKGTGRVGIHSTNYLRKARAHVKDEIDKSYPIKYIVRELELVGTLSHFEVLEVQGLTIPEWTKTAVELIGTWREQSDFKWHQ